MFLTNALSRIFAGLWDSISYGFTLFGVFGWDTLLTLYNALTFNVRRGTLIPKGKLGHGGIWPAYEPPKEGDSRSSCPALNALANHGILPHDGRNISFKRLNEAVYDTYNFAPSFCFFVPLFSARMLSRNYYTDTFNLSDLSAHNGIEHDASLTRHDTAHAPDQGKPALDLIDQLLSMASGPDGTLTPTDLSRFSEIRRAHSQKTNGQFTLSTFHKVFGSSNASTMLRMLGGNTKDLSIWLKEERLPDGYESSCRSRMGLTMASFNSTVLRVELGIRNLPAPVSKEE